MTIDRADNYWGGTIAGLLTIPMPVLLTLTYICSMYSANLNCHIKLLVHSCVCLYPHTCNCCWLSDSQCELDFLSKKKAAKRKRESKGGPFHVLSFSAFEDGS